MAEETLRARSAYQPHPRLQKSFKLPSRTQQSFRDETNINNILEKYRKTGLVEHVKNHGGKYAELPNHEDFHHAMNLVTSAQQMFDELPAGVRAEFHNDPSQFLEFVTDEENEEEMIEMGLVAPAPAREGERETEGDDPPEEAKEPPEEADKPGKGKSA